MTELRAPERPRFFPGQLLTDADLQAIVTWCDDRLATAARRGGARVNAGFAFTPDAADPLRFSIGPGRAVDALGREIVLTRPARCRIRREDLLEEAEGEPVHDAFLGVPTLRHRRRTFALRLASHEQETHPRTRSVDDPGHDAWANSRVREDGRVLDPQRIDSAVDRRGTQHAAAWRECVADSRELLPDVGGPGARVDLLARLGARPPRHFTSLTSLVGALDPISAGDMRRVLIMLAVDRRLSLLDEDVEVDDPEPDVLLGTLAVAIPVDDASPPFVLGYEPASRDRQGPQRAAPAGEVDLSEMLWLPSDDVARFLAERGLHAREVEVMSLDDAAWLARWCDESPSLPAADEITVEALDVPGLGSRVVGWSSARRKVLVDLVLEQQVHPTQVEQGDSVTFRYLLRNTGQTAVTVRVGDDAFDGDLLEKKRLAPGESHSFEQDLRLTDAALGVRTSTSRASYVPVDGGAPREAVAQCRWEVIAPRGDKPVVRLACSANWFTGRVRVDATIDNPASRPIAGQIQWKIESGSKVVPDVLEDDTFASIEPGARATHSRAATLGFRRRLGVTVIPSTQGILPASQEASLSIWVSAFPWVLALLLAACLVLTAVTYALDLLYTLAVPLAYLMWRLQVGRRRWKSV